MSYLLIEEKPVSQTIRSVIALVIQVVLGYVLGFGIYALGIGNGLELVALPLISTLVVWGVGFFFAKQLASKQDSGSLVTGLVTTLLGSAVGVWLILQIGAVGFIGMFTLPLLGALFGYYFGLSLSSDR
jgi:hypothetical protein